MREIKFRAWHKKERRMSCPFTLGDLYGYEGEFNAVHWECGDDHWPLCSHDSSARDGAVFLMYPQLPSDNGLNPHIELMQYTGLKDKNGVEVYEGDILEISGFYFMDILKQQDVTDLRGEVWHDSEIACFNIGDLRWNVIPRKDLARKYFEVIGNRFENPELLTQKNEK